MVDAIRYNGKNEVDVCHWFGALNPETMVEDEWPLVVEGRPIKEGDVLMRLKNGEVRYG